LEQEREMLFPEFVLPIFSLPIEFGEEPTEPPAGSHSMVMDAGHSGPVLSLDILPMILLRPLALTLMILISFGFLKLPTRQEMMFIA